MKRATDSRVALHDFPVAVDGVRGFAAAIMDDAAPHLKSEEREGQDEEDVEDEDVAQLMKRNKERRNQHSHRRELRQAAQGSEKSKGSQRGDV